MFVLPFMANKDVYIYILVRLVEDRDGCRRFVFGAAYARLPGTVNSDRWSRLASTCGTVQPNTPCVTDCLTFRCRQSAASWRQHLILAQSQGRQTHGTATNSQECSQRVFCDCGYVSHGFHTTNMLASIIIRETDELLLFRKLAPFVSLKSSSHH